MTGKNTSIFATEKELRSALQVQPEQVISRVFGAHRADLRRLVAARMDKRLRQRVDPSDIVQETYAEAFLRIGDYLTSPNLTFVNWLRSLASQQVIVAHRRHVVAKMRSVERERGSQPGDERVDVAEIASDSTDPDQKILNRENNELLLQAIGLLSHRLREVVRLRFIDEMSLPDIAEKLDITKEAASKRSIRGLQRLAKLIESGGGRSESGTDAAGETSE